ncbi:MAG TPA: hypothetical protein VMH88_02465 [Gemmatimonadales bacterium]|nr:hypothetical protein [Gemmatimonadales bacterium]
MTPFEHRPDPELGALLRAALEPSDHAGFVARVVAAVEHRDAPTVDVLARWARVGIAAAVLAAVAAGLALHRSTSAAAVDDALTGAEAGAVFAARTPDASVVLASWPER